MHVGKFQPMYFGKRYRDWLMSRPFDIGNTTRSAFSIYQVHAIDEEITEIAHKHVQKCNHASCSNGSLMRATPLAVFCHRLPEEQMLQVVATEVGFTHCHTDVITAIQIYCLGIGKLLNGVSAKDTFEQCLKFAEEKQMLTVVAWLQLAQTMTPTCDVSLLNPAKKIGWLKHGFVLSFMHLLDPEITYEKAISRTLKMAGDTDTNCAIVGGMIGALVGFDALPQDYSTKVLTVSLAFTSYTRPAEI